ncbi:MAG: hypothetical protein U0165_14900 [Polyangiaceae bacterium]
MGRATLLESMERACATARIVTLLGPPGVGKTRLAVELLSRSEREGALVDLTESNDVLSAGSAILSAFALSQHDADAWGCLVRSLPRDALIVLDNVEQLAPVIAADVVKLADSRSDLSLLLTSRVPLGVELENVMVIPPLSMADDLQQGDAAHLFRTRLREAGLPSPPAEIVSRLVEVLDGLPPAIELAAARARVMAPAEMLRLLDAESSSPESSKKPARFRLLGRLEKSPRRWSLEESIESSLRLLSVEDRSVLEQASAFRGGFSLEAAEAVLSCAERDVLDVLAQLERASLVLIDTTGESTRYRLLLAIREHVESHRRRGIADAEIRARHAEWVLDAATRHSKRSVELRAWLSIERENVAAALATLTEQRRAKEAISLATMAAEDSGLSYSTRAERLDAALRSAAAELAPEEVAKARLALADMLRFLGRERDSLSELEKALPLALAAHSASLVARVHAGRGNALTMQAQWSAARDAFDQALLAYRQAGDPRAEGRVLAMIASTYFSEDSWSECRSLLDTSLGLLLRAGDEDGEAMVRISVGFTELARGDLDRAAAPLTEGLYLARRVGNRHWEAMALGALARRKIESGDRVEGRAALMHALEESRRLGVRRAEAVALFHLGALMLEENESNAEPTLLEAARLSRVVCPDLEPLVLIALSFAARARGDDSLAASRLDEAQALAQAFPRPSTDAALSVARGGVSAVSRAVDVVLVQRLAKRFPASSELRESTQQRLIVGPACVWFRFNQEPVVRLRRRVAIARILEALVALHERPGAAPLLAKELVAIGWPGERLIEQAGLDRVYAAIATLRKLGLRGALVEREGYRLNPALSVERCAQANPDEGVSVDETL